MTDDADIDTAELGTAPPPFPNLRHLLSVTAVAHLKSVSLAAEDVHISQPALTQAISRLEAQVGAKLFKRTTAGMFLTPAGEVYIARAIRALTHIRDGISDIGQAKNGRSFPLERMMTSAQLRALVSVVDNGNFAMAARASGLSQPSIHRAARDLERLVGTTLYERTSFGVQPTKEARKLSLSAKRAFTEMRNAWAEVQALSGVYAGTTVIGTMPLARTYLVPKAVIAFASDFPNQNIEIEEGPYEHLIEGLRSGDIDMLVGAMRPSLPVDDVRQEPLFEDVLSIVARVGHPLFEIANPTMADFMAYPWIAPRRGTPLRRNFEQLFHEALVPFPKRVIECNSLVAARVLMTESDHLMLLSSHQIRYEKQMNLLAELKSPFRPLIRSIGLTVRSDWVPTPAQERLLNILQDESRGL